MGIPPVVARGAVSLESPAPEHAVHVMANMTMLVTVSIPVIMAEPPVRMIVLTLAAAVASVDLVCDLQMNRLGDSLGSRVIDDSSYYRTRLPLVF